MKLWILYAIIFFSLALVFFHRQFHPRNQMFAAWLVAGVAAQVFFSFSLAAGRRWPTIEILIAVLGWVLLAASTLVAYRASDSINRIIFLGLAANILLHLPAALGWIDPRIPQEIKRWTSNLGGIVPALFMLAAFSGARLDRLPVWTAEILRSAQNDRIRAALGHARALLG